MDFRIGQGFDVHRFGGAGPVTLGGVKIAHEFGLVAHSDGDVLLHALCDALLGAAGMGDIGQHFPDTDAAYRGADSRGLLRQVVGLLHAGGWRIGNVDCTVIAEKPKVMPHAALMRGHIAADLGVHEERVNIKATTSEGLGFTGRKEGIAAQAVALLVRL
ncbi:MAG: 2-C-methyl-D-erythritol 2,4-cyclodiphosphate synthase [Gammaproteobacteria bacterium]|nr:2-C-methyl-D-erythritol 2,4-cyclodiphosphate synthase [Gammaproteobacteria bacterium]